jgi:hypothetical protein
MHFSGKREIIIEGIIVGLVYIAPKIVVRWLGVFLDSKLTFKPYVQRKAMAAALAYNRLKSLGNT